MQTWAWGEKADYLPYFDSVEGAVFTQNKLGFFESFDQQRSSESNNGENVQFNPGWNFCLVSSWYFSNNTFCIGYACKKN